MKKTLLAIGLLIAVFHSNAQRQGLWISPQLTIGGGTMTDISPTSFTSDASAIFNFGAEGYWMFNNHIGIGTGINYGGYGLQWSSSVSRDNLEYRATQVTMDVPVFLRLVTGSRGGFFAHFGFTNSFLLTAEEKLNVNGSEYAKITGKAAKQDFRSYSISPFIYFGGNIGIGNKVQMTLGPQIQYQLNTNFSNSSGLDGHYLTFGVKACVGIHAYNLKTN